MNGLLDDVLATHGGLERWRAVTALTVHATFGGLLRTRFPGNRMTNVTARVRMADQLTVLYGFPRDDLQAIFEHGDVRIETSDGRLVAARSNARNAFTGVGAVRRAVRWDGLDAAYFAGYAFWNYFSTPLLLARDDIKVIEAGAWQEAGKRWHRLEVSFPGHLHTHSPRQTFYVDDDGLLRRHDYTAQPVGPWARAAHYCDHHRQFGGLVFPTRRRVRPRGRRNRSLPAPTLVALDIDYIDIEN
ncbi:hypothetical protein A5658_05390 [Mycobacterium sp. 1245111.1]|uniref:hypothetical protein n=1 Tax=Mycobacterium sp. 1245111.1 TaxID=1834073 RepID=UPI0007FD3AE2|nr:hypothetical protein [Mycobacterium sp. 1245111.1]OBK36853.1 hypothetical protein A5658_05390 [Mycobacterium sp. 1245111.1]